MIETRRISPSRPAPPARAASSEFFISLVHAPSARSPSRTAAANAAAARSSRGRRQPMPIATSLSARIAGPPASRLGRSHLTSAIVSPDSGSAPQESAQPSDPSEKFEEFPA